MTLRTCVASVRYSDAICPAAISVADANKIIARIRDERCLASVATFLSLRASAGSNARTNTSAERTQHLQDRMPGCSTRQRRFRSNVSERPTSPMTAGDVTADGRSRVLADGNEIPLLGLG